MDVKQVVGQRHVALAYRKLRAEKRLHNLKSASFTMLDKFEDDYEDYTFVLGSFRNDFSSIAVGVKLETTS